MKHAWRIFKALVRMAIILLVGVSVGDYLAPIVLPALGVKNLNCRHYTMETTAVVDSMLVCYTDEEKVCHIVCVPLDRALNRLCDVNKGCIEMCL